MSKKLTKKQKEAIKVLEDAFKLMKKAKLAVCGMDDSIYYATDKAIKEAPEKYEQYCSVANAHKYFYSKWNIDSRVGKIETSGVYIDSGGW